MAVHIVRKTRASDYIGTHSWLLLCTFSIFTVLLSFAPIKLKWGNAINSRYTNEKTRGFFTFFFGFHWSSKILLLLRRSLNFTYAVHCAHVLFEVAILIENGVVSTGKHTYDTQAKLKTKANPIRCGEYEYNGRTYILHGTRLTVQWATRYSERSTNQNMFTIMRPTTTRSAPHQRRSRDTCIGGIHAVKRSLNEKTLSLFL